jgi:hypothetical protein
VAEENTEVEVEKKPENEEVSDDLGLEALKNMLAQQKAAAEAAERRAQQAEQRAVKAERRAVTSEAEVQNSDLQIVVSAIETVTRDNAMAKRALAEAMAAQDFEKVAEAQDVISMSNAKLLSLQNGRAALEQRVREAAEAPKREEPAIPSDPVEALAGRLSPKSAQWVRAHPEYARDPHKNLVMIGAHNMAVGHGMVPDSDEYFDYVETQLGIRRGNDGDDAMDAAAKPMARKSQPPAAPPSRGGSNGRGIRLSEAQREAAAISGLTEEEYATNLAAENKKRAH